MTGVSWKHWVFLSDDQLARGAKVGTAKHKWGLEQYRRGEEYMRTRTNNLPRDDAKNLAADIMGAKCELAGKVFLGPWATWNEEAGWGKPDLEDFIDVKGIPQQDLHLIVPASKLKRSWAYMLVVEEEPWFLIKGWKWGEHIGPRLLPSSKKNSRPCFMVEDSELHDPCWLIEVALGGKK